MGNKNLNYLAIKNCKIITLDQAIPFISEGTILINKLNGFIEEIITKKKIPFKFQKHIKFLGYVDDLNDYLSACTAVLIPLSFGTGVKLKTIVSLKKGIPIISTDYGVEGINVVNYKECIVENKFERYPSLMKSIMDSTINSELSINSKLFYDINYSKSAIYKEYGNLFFHNQ